MDWFAQQLLDWWDQCGRHDLAWQKNRTAYRVWVSEIMLQQTQTTTVDRYFDNFMSRFPTVESLASAELDDVLGLWSGLGYYSRARNLHATARIVSCKFGGEFPRTVEQLTALPGIGRSTAGAILAQAFDLHGVILDANVRRVLARFHGVEGDTRKAQNDRYLWESAQEHTPTNRVGDYTQAVMDLGALCCRSSSPSCGSCPVNARCQAQARDIVHLIPAKRSERNKERRRVRVFVVVDRDGHCLLQRRPDSGIWSSLWTCPQTERSVTVKQFLPQVGIDQEVILKEVVSDVFRYSLSHIDFEIEPVYLSLNGYSGKSDLSEDHRWHSIKDREELGMSALTVKLINQAMEQFETT